MTFEKNVEPLIEKTPPRNPAISLAGCHRIVVVGKSGSGKTTLARELAAALGVPHVELDSLCFDPDFNIVPLSVFRERTRAAIAGDRWVIDGNKRAVRDLVWPRADTLIWLDYPLIVSIWRLGKRALWRASAIQKQATEPRSQKTRLPKQFVPTGNGGLTALRSHLGQFREYPRLFAKPENQHLAIVRLRSPQAARHWLARVTEKGITPP